MVRTMSGIQPTGSLHIGNYLGALVNWVKLQEEYDAYFCVVDLHALTQRPSADALREAVREIAIGVLASGVDPDRATLFVQSHVPQHTELSWILTCLTPLASTPMAISRTASRSASADGRCVRAWRSTTQK